MKVLNHTQIQRVSGAGILYDPALCFDQAQKLQNMEAGAAIGGSILALAAGIFMISQDYSQLGAVTSVGGIFFNLFMIDVYHDSAVQYYANYC